MSKVQNYIEVIAGIIGGGSLTAMFQSWRESKKDKSDEVFRIIDQYKELIEQHKSQIEQHKLQVSKMEKAEEECKLRLEKHESIIDDLRHTIMELRNKMIQLETTNNDFPFPCWFKDMNHHMVWINPAYEELILKPNGKTEQDYIGKSDIDVWGDELGLSYQISDKKSIRHKGGVVITNEKVIIAGADMTDAWKIVKWVRYLGTTPIGYCGAAIPV